MAETIGVEIGRQTKAVELVPDRRAYDALVRSFLLRRRFGERGTCELRMGLRRRFSERGVIPGDGVLRPRLY